MLTGLNKDGVTRWQQSETKSPEPEAWRAFKVSINDQYVRPAILLTVSAFFNLSEF